MAKSIYDVLNTIDLYIKITESIYSKNSPSWDEVVEVQKRVISILSDKDLNGIILKEVVDSSSEVYINLYDVLLKKKERFIDLINFYDLKGNENVFQVLFEHKRNALERNYQAQLKKTTAIRQEYESYDRALESPAYSMPEDEFRILVERNAQEQKVLESNLNIQKQILDELYNAKEKFIHKNFQYIKSYHKDLSTYINELIRECFIRNRVSQVNKDQEDLILSGSILPNSNVFDNIYTVIANDVFEYIERNSFVNIFQGHRSKIRLKIKKSNIQNVYFVLFNLSEYLEDADSKNWLEHVIKHIEWGGEWTLENVIEKIRKKRKGASEAIKIKLAGLITINPKEFN